ncbi:hypothetical protein HZB94_03825 [Candidatus Falkowbacteria bacterium]|nr:hypothetical protein [Candidatus Falkowbacteria bacterium]
MAKTGKADLTEREQKVVQSEMASLTALLSGWELGRGSRLTIFIADRVVRAKVIQAALQDKINEKFGGNLRIAIHKCNKKDEEYAELSLRECRKAKKKNE